MVPFIYKLKSRVNIYINSYQSKTINIPLHRRNALTKTAHKRRAPQPLKRMPRTSPCQ